MSNWDAAARAKYKKEHPENFAGPGDSYPIKDSEDVRSAWNLAGHAKFPDAVRREIIKIAKRLGLSDALPDTAKGK
ncbi:MAG TPA: hypothetical protein VIG47_15565 [Gemmatimonadaceae bacterium]